MLHVLLFLFFLLFSSCVPLFSSADDDAKAFVYAGCSPAKYDPATPYRFYADSLLSSLANAAAFASYANFTASSAATPVYGLFQCRADLPVPTCESCVSSAASQITSLCPTACGAALQLRGCLLRYGNDSFVGRPDDTLIYKKCGPVASGGVGGDVTGMRDAALAAVQGGAGGYRVGAAGSVQGVAQCVGDIGEKACADCVADAMAQLSGSCGLAVSGDVYLAKCYARYWTNGASYSSGSSSKSNNNGDETGKTLAIIIGFIAGIALLVFLLSYIGRAGKGKK